jgi:hypothetical protein
MYWHIVKKGLYFRNGNIRQLLISSIILLFFPFHFETASGGGSALPNAGCFYFTQSDSAGSSSWFGPAGQLSPGVNIHFTKGHTKELDMIAAAGFRYIRTDFVWQDIETEKGLFNWDAYDELTTNLEKRGLRALYILDYSNSLYEDTVSSSDPITGETIMDISAPVREEIIAAFSRWAAEAAIRYRNRNIVWEIWNEPNVSFWKPVPDIEQYNKLALATCIAMKKAVPETILIGPAASQIPFSFIETFLTSGILKYLDGVSVHPYRDYSLPPESVADDYVRLREIIQSRAPAGIKDIPLISSEWGYASCPKGLTEEKQASYAVRMQLANLLAGVPVSVWYDWKNDGESPTNFEHNCGTVTFNLEPKPAYRAIGTMTSQLGGLTLAHRITTESDKDYILLFINRKGLFRLCAWTTDTPHSVKLDVTLAHTKSISAKDGYGNSISIKTEKDGLLLDLDELPKYITLPCGIRVN